MGGGFNLVTYISKKGSFRGLLRLWRPRAARCGPQRLPALPWLPVVCNHRQGCPKDRDPASDEDADELHASADEDAGYMYAIPEA